MSTQTIQDPKLKSQNNVKKLYGMEKVRNFILLNLEIQIGINKKIHRNH